MKMKKPVKFKSAEAKRAWEENEKSWAQVVARHTPTRIPAGPSNQFSFALTAPPGRETVRHPSLETAGHSTAQKKMETYTGDRIRGIGVLHKSCLQPIWSDEQAKEIASMRR
jgi:hypothetical protein